MPLALNLARRACIGGQPLIDFAHLLAMTEPDLETTLREFREYLTRSYEPQNKIAARVGVTQSTLSGWLAAKHCLNVRSLAKLRAFLDAEAKRNAKNGKVISESINQATAHSVGIIAGTPDIPIVADKTTPPIVPANFDSGTYQGAVVSDARTVHGERAIRTARKLGGNR